MSIIQSTTFVIGSSRETQVIPNQGFFMCSKIIFHSGLGWLFVLVLQCQRKYSQCIVCKIMPKLHCTGTVFVCSTVGLKLLLLLDVNYYILNYNNIKKISHLYGKSTAYNSVDISTSFKITQLILTNIHMFSQTI